MSSSRLSGRAQNRWTLTFLDTDVENHFLAERKHRIIVAIGRCNQVSLLILLGYAAFLFIDVARGGQQPLKNMQAWLTMSAMNWIVTSTLLAFNVAFCVLSFTSTLHSLSPWAIEFMASAGVCMAFFVIPCFNTFYSAKISGVDPYLYYLEKEGEPPYFSESRLLLMSLLLTAWGHVLIPIRWCALLPLEVILILRGPMLHGAFGSPERSEDAAMNDIFMFFITMVIAVGKRGAENTERRTTLRYLHEKSLRFATEFELSQQREARADRGGVMKKPRYERSIQDSMISSDVPVSHCVFTIDADDTVSNLEYQLGRLINLAKEENWYIEPDKLQFHEKGLLGKGGNGTVVCGVYLGAKVALKAPFGDREPSDQQLTHLANEIRILRKVKHPHIVAFYGACVLLNCRSIVLCEEYIPGKSLLEVVRDRGDHLTRAHRHQILLDIVSALCYLHGMSPAVIHGDLKPSNVMIEKRAPHQAKLFDFGLSLRQGFKDAIGGTAQWMAPEVMAAMLEEGVVPVTGQSRYGTKTDVFSFGRLAYFVITGLNPMANLSLEQVRDALGEGRVLPLSWPDEPVDWQDEGKALCEQSLRFKPEERTDAAVLLIALSSWDPPDEDMMISGHPSSTSSGPYLNTQEGNEFRLIALFRPTAIAEL